MSVKSTPIAILAVCAAGLAVTGCGGSRPATSPALRRAAHVAGAVEAWGRFGGGGGRTRVTVMPKGTGMGAGVGPVRTRPTVVDGVRGTVRQVSTSNSDGYALTRAGAVYAWGAGGQGELGDGATVSLSLRAVRVRFPAGVKIASLPDPIPFDGGMAIDTRGRVWAWGNDLNQEFCLAHSALLDRPVKVPLTDVTLAVGAARHATYDTGGRIVSCGLGEFGQLGNGTTGLSSETATPVAVRGLPAGRVIALTAAYGNTGALMADGTYYDWGTNADGQLGDGTTAESDTPVKVTLPGPARLVSMGGSLANNGQTMALLSNGALWEWGAGKVGQLGDGATANRARPFRLSEPRGAHFVAVSSGGQTDYAIDQHGRLWSWGGDTEGDVGRGATGGPVTRPVKHVVRVSQVSATAHDAVILTARR
jgi:regulator of chromosome condensation (RCC1) repeat-containing protein